MKIYIAILLTILTIVGCEAKKDNGIGDEVKEVQYYLDNETERNRVVGICDGNPGELSENGNCVNAYTAKDQVQWSAKGPDSRKEMQPLQFQPPPSKGSE
jgi:hypothetical protein